jgi:Zn-dependent membrane protease YugP
MIMLPSMAIAGIAQMLVKSAYARYSQVPSRRGMSGAEAAQLILRANALDHVAVEQTQGWLGDHYDPKAKVLRLSPDVYHGRSLAAVGIAAHEAGHAIQDKVRYAPLALRNGIVPMANLGGNLAWILLAVGFLMQSTGMLLAACIVFGTVVLFQLVNLPVEFNASNRARAVLVDHDIISQDEEPGVAKVLNAAAMTYVAATITAILQLLYFLIRAGVIGGRRN